MIFTNIQGKRWPLAFTLDAMDALEESTGKSVSELKLGIDTKAERDGLLVLLAAMIRAGAPEGAETPDADALRKMLKTPGQLLIQLGNVTDAINKGMEMETAEPDDDAEVDLVLEEIEKKEPGGA